jgi:2-desacetyl-2-hydroxyethyl bacteriochlorophyllide A dehydrogenase
MRAVVYEGINKLAIADRPTPEPGPHQVLVETAAVGICGTDLHVLQGEFEGTVFPIVPGHEATGTVMAFGSEVEGLTVGDKVVVAPATYCNECEYCMNGRGNLCRKWGGIGMVETDGASQQQFLAAKELVYKLKPETNLYHAALIEPIACVIHAYDLINTKLGQHYLVYGSGTIGLLVAQLAWRVGAATVTIVDVNESRLQTARELGFTQLHTSADQAERSSFDIVVDCTGVIKAIEDGIPRVKPGGTFLHFGVAPVEATASYSPFRLFRDEITILGTMAVHQSFGRAVEMFEAGAINPEPLISHSFSIEDYDKALEMFSAGSGRKVQIRPNDTESRVLLDLK